MLKSGPPSEETMAKNTKITSKWLKIIDRWLSQQPYIIPGGDSPTLCDLQAYCEISQLEPKPHGFGVIDLSAYPNIQRWLKDMKKLPHHDSVHKAMHKLASKL